MTAPADRALLQRLAAGPVSGDALARESGLTRAAVWQRIEALREAGVAVGLLKLRLFRPLPAAALRAALAGVPDVVVLDRDHSPGCGGVLHQELRAALYGMPGAPRIHGYLAGVGGLNVAPEHIEAFVQRALGGTPQPFSEWVR